MNDYNALINDRPHFTSGGHNELPPDPAIPTLVIVNLDTLVPYQGNPRQSRNPAYDEIKESIRNIGLQYPPNVTRADPSHPYMIRDGGNTRLQILRELWEETNDRRYFEFKCMFHPYTDDMDMLIKHCIENEMRGGMLLIERGLAALKFKESIEKSDPKNISNKALARELSQKGWTVGDVVLGVALYAATLTDVIPTALWAGMGKDQIQRLRKNITDCRNFWLSLDDKKDDLEGAEEEFTLIWQEALREADSEELTVDKARDEIEGAMADYLGCPVMTLRGDIQAMSEGVSRGGSVPKSVLTGNLPDLTVKPQNSGTSIGGSSSKGTKSSAETYILQEAARTNTQEAAQRTRESGSREITREAATSSPSASGTSNNGYNTTMGVGFDNDQCNNDGLDFHDFGPGAEEEHEFEERLGTAEEIRLEIFSTAENLARMYGFEHLVMPGDQLAPGTDHFGYLMLAPSPEVQTMFMLESANKRNNAPSAIYRQLLNLSAACKFAFPNSPDLHFFNYLAFGSSPEECAMRLTDDSWLAMLRIALPGSDQVRMIERIERLALQLIHIINNDA